MSTTLSALATSTHALLADQYLDRLAFGWQKRQRALDSHVLDFAALVNLDQSLLSYAKGLAIVNTAATEVIASRLQDPLTRGELFAIALYAMKAQNAALHDTCIGLIQAMPTLRAAYLAALDWAGAESAWWALMQWPQDQTIDAEWLFHVFSLAACRTYPSIFTKLEGTPWWQYLIQCDPDHKVMMMALMQTALVTGTPEAVARAPALLQSNHAKLRCLGAEVVLRQIYRQPPTIHTQQAIDVLAELAASMDDPQLATQATFALACCPRVAFDGVLQDMSAQAEQCGLYLQALGWRGNGQAVPTLIDYLNHPVHARAAGAALSMLTGSLPARDGWQADPIDTAPPMAEVADDSATIPPAKLYADLPPPDQTGFTHWWSQNRQQFALQLPLLAGQPVSHANLITVLQSGKLSWRRVAAARLCTQTLEADRFNSDAPTFHQQHWLAQHSLSPTR
jgi:uncharacterized protein (TIGR02270 family)